MALMDYELVDLIVRNKYSSLAVTLVVFAIISAILYFFGFLGSKVSLMYVPVYALVIEVVLFLSCVFIFEAGGKKASVVAPAPMVQPAPVNGVQVIQSKRLRK
jgi:hypothetical protein